MQKLIWPAVLLAGLLVSACGGGSDDPAPAGSPPPPVLTPPTPTPIVPEQATMSELGRELFFDTNLSSPAGQACATCHDPAAGFADPDSDMPTSEGVMAGRFGGRNTPTAAYASLSPVFEFTNDPAVDPAVFFYVGGQFLDGRAADLVEQAKGPFLNPIEMANPDKAAVVNKVRNSAYAGKFVYVFGADAFADSEVAYDNIATAIAEFEKSPELNPFSSKFDFFQKGMVTLNAQETLGLDVFQKKGKCATCHLLPETLPAPMDPPASFTDFRYFNLGVPKNPNNPFYTQDMAFNPDGASFIDNGLGAEVQVATKNGKFKTSTLRNIELTAPYMHNGVFATLEEVVDFYNTDDPPAPEVDNDITADVGFLDLTPDEEAALVAFLKTLTDGYVVP